MSRKKITCGKENIPTIWKDIETDVEARQIAGCCRHFVCCFSSLRALLVVPCSSLLLGKLLKFIFKNFR